MTDITLTLTVDEVNAVLQTLGNLPTSSGAYPLMMKVKQQAEVAMAAATAGAATAGAARTVSQAIAAE